MFYIQDLSKDFDLLQQDDNPPQHRYTNANFLMDAAHMRLYKMYSNHHQDQN